MNFTDLIGTELIHKTFGNVTVTDVFINENDFERSKFEIDTGKKHIKLMLFTIDKYFIDVPEDLINEINIFKLDKTSEQISFVKPKLNIKFYNYDESDNELSKKDIEKLHNNVMCYWWAFGSISPPVISDNKTLYSSAKAACNALGINLVAYPKIYEICNDGVIKKTFKGHKWRFATHNDIDRALEVFDE